MSSQVCDPDKGCWLLSNCEWNETDFQCIHDPILELSVYTGFVYSLIPIFLGIGLAGGLGSGMIKRPILNLLLNYPSRIATQVADCFLISTTALNSILLFFEKHPDHPELPLVNFNISIIFNLTIPLAWSFGALLSQVIPTFIIYLCQISFLICAFPFLWRFTTSQKQLEQDKRNSKVLIDSKIKTAEDIAAETNFDDKKLKLYQKIYENDHSKIQVKNLLLIIGSFIINQTIVVMRSNNYNNSILGLNPCTIANELIIFVLLGANIIYSAFVYWVKRNEEYQKDLVQYRMEERFFSPYKTFWLYYIGGWLAGFSTGFIGMGGGIILVTFLLHQRIIAREAAATSAFGSFMISLNSLIQLILQRTITTAQLLAFFAFGFIGVFLFTKPAYMLMNKYKIGYVVLIIDMIQVCNNIISIFALIAIRTSLFGFDSMMENATRC